MFIIKPMKTPRLPHLIDITIAAATCSMLAAITFIIVKNLDHGVDVSDGAYYIMSYAMVPEIGAQATLAGWLWAAIFPIKGILANRYVLLATLPASIAALALIQLRCADLPPVSFFQKINVAATSATGALIYYIYWFPDPSYNSITFIMLAGLWAAFCCLLRAISGLNKIFDIVSTLFVGAFAMAVAISKPTSIIPLIIVLPILYFRQIGKCRAANRIIIHLVSVMVGTLAPIIIIYISGVSPVRVWSALSEGSTLARNLTPPSLDPIAPFTKMVSELSNASFYRKWPVIIFMIGMPAIVILKGVMGLQRIGNILFIGMLAISFLPVIAALEQEIATTRTTGLALAALCIYCMIIIAFDQPRLDRAIARRATILALIFSFAYTFGTANQWAFQVIGASGFVWCSAATIIALSSKSLRGFTALPLLGLLGASVINTARGLEFSPYRIAAPLSALATPAIIGPHNEVFLESDIQAEFYNKLAQARRQIELTSKRPILIDMSGRTPMVAYQIGARIPRNPWLLSGYPGSDDVFRAVLKTIPIEDIQSAWIFQMKDYDRRFSDQLLAEFGVDFPAQYVERLTIQVSYMGMNGTLYSPKAQTKN